MKSVNLKHNYSVGHINYCQVCNNKKIQQVMDFGYQPLADDLIPFSKPYRKSLFYPLVIMLCKKCELLQCNYIVGDENLYTKDYHYLPGISKLVIDNFKELSLKLKKLYFLNQKSVIIDAGCNDGSLLQEFKNLGIKKVVGIDPTDTVQRLKKRNIKFLQDYLNIESANKVKNIYGSADLIVTTNVFAHTNKLKDFILSVKKLLKKSGTFVVENHYLVDVLKKKQFDTFYHEHLRTYSLKSLIKLMSYYNLYLIDAYTSDRYGGNIQAHFSFKKKKFNERIKQILIKEKKSNLSSTKTYQNFFMKIEKAKREIDVFLSKNKQKKIVAKAFPARASVLIHYFSNLKNYIQFIAEQPSSNKINYYAPGTNIKIISSTIFKKFKPDIMVILAWHMFDDIKNKWIDKGIKKCKYVKLLPELKIYNE